MKKRTILFLTLSLLLVLAFVQVSLVSASEEEGCVGEECGYVPPDDYVCEDPEGCPAEPDPEPEPDPDPGEGEWCADGVLCPEEPEEVVDDCAFGNPGNATCVGKAGEKWEVTDPAFWVEDGPAGHDPGTHGRSDPWKHKPHPSVPPAEE